MTQLFIELDKHGNIVIAIPNFVDDLFIIGHLKNLEALHTAIGSRFKNGRLLIDQELIFNGLGIRPGKAHSINYNMCE